MLTRLIILTWAARYVLNPVQKGAPRHSSLNRFIVLSGMVAHGQRKITTDRSSGT